MNFGIFFELRELMKLNLSEKRIENYRPVSIFRADNLSRYVKSFLVITRVEKN